MDKRRKIMSLEIKIDQARLVIDDLGIMKKYNLEERHNLCNYVLKLQSQYYKLTERFYYGKPKE